MSVTKNFYQNVIGLPLLMDTPGIIIFAAGSVGIGFMQASPKNQSGFSPFEIGLDHLAMGCETVEELQRVAKGLADAGIESTGVKTDETLGKQYIAFKDPDRLQWEFYMVS